MIFGATCRKTAGANHQSPAAAVVPTTLTHPSVATFRRNRWLAPSNTRSQPTAVSMLRAIAARVSSLAG